MKRLFLSLAILASVSFLVPANAQEGRGRENREGRQRSELPKELNLTADQQKKIEAVHEDFKAKITDLRSKSGLSREDRMSESKEIREQYSSSINNILTLEQQNKWKELKAKRINKTGKGNKDTGMHTPKREAAKALNLTDDQKQRIKSLNDDYRVKSKDLARVHREGLKEIYTSEQQAKVDQFRENCVANRFALKKGGKGMHYRLDDASRSKLVTLRENFIKEKKAIEMSRIAPDAQKRKIADLNKNFRKEKLQLIKDTKKAEVQNPT